MSAHTGTRVRAKRVRYDGGVREERGEEEVIVESHSLTDQGSGSQEATRDQAVQRELIIQRAIIIERGIFRAAAVCLTALCVLVAVRTTGMALDYHSGNELLKNLTLTLTNVTLVRDQLQSEVNQLRDKADQLQTRYNKLKEMTSKGFFVVKPHGFTFGGGVCYRIFTGKKSWEESRQNCIDTQSDLMTINSKEKQDFVNRTVNSFNQNMWLGLTDREVEGVWKWVDGTPLTTPTYWRPGEPNDYDDKEDCVEFMDGSWLDISCSDKNGWICERVI